MKNLKKLRLRLKMSQKALADRVFLNVRTIQRHEKHGVPKSRVKSYIEALS